MYKETKYDESSTRKNKPRIIICECDQCGQIFEKSYRKRLENTTAFTFCSEVCRSSAYRVGGMLRLVIDEKTKHTNIEKYGVECVFQSSEIKDKIKTSNLEKYGVEVPSQSSEIMDKIKKTNLERYGVENAMQCIDIQNRLEQSLLNTYCVSNVSYLPEIRRKAEQTNLEQYGFKHASQAPEIQDVIKQTNVERYGVECILSLPEMQKTLRRFVLEQYGVEYISQSEEIKTKKKQTCFEHYGVNTPAQHPDIQAKMHDTAKRNGTYARQASYLEDKIFDILQAKYGNDIVERHYRVKSWIMDFYIKSFNVYINLDGEYWHGLNRPVEDIKDSTQPRDQSIYKAYLRDQRKVEYFAANNLNLVIITDKEYIKAEKSDTIDQLLNDKLGKYQIIP